MDPDAAKRAAAHAALAYLPESGVIGLGTGSTARHFISAVAALIEQGRKLCGVATSEQSRRQATELGIPLLSDDGPFAIDLTVDGADEVSPELNLIKGGGGCHTREKIVNRASKQNLIVVDESKLVAKLGTLYPVPVEVLQFGHRETCRELETWGSVTLRRHNERPFLTDSGNLIYDLRVEPSDDPVTLDQALRQLPGVIETGLFLGAVDRVIVAGEKGVFELPEPR
jgi:ribose 5-phosphate isomerase A